MKNALVNLSFLLVCHSLLGSCVNNIEKSSSQEVLPISAIVVKKEEVENTLYSPIPVIGTIDELGKDTSCGQETIHGYAETQKERIYLCGNAPIPSFLVFISTDNKSSTTVIRETPLKIASSYRFKKGAISYSLRRPSPIFQSGSFTIYDHSLGKIITTQSVSRYLFNKQISPNYQKSFTPPDKQAKERFLKFLPTFRKQIDTCHSELYGEPVRSPKSVTAYKIDSEKYLIEMLCLGGSYNLVWQYVVYSESSSKQQGEIVKFQTLRPPNFENIESEIIIGNPEFFPEENTLTVFSKGNGKGGCGSFAEYKLVGSRFELQEFRDKNCDGKLLLPQEFPKIYP